MSDCPACIYAENEAIMERRLVERYGDNVRLEPPRSPPMAHTCGKGAATTRSLLFGYEVPANVYRAGDYRRDVEALGVEWADKIKAWGRVPMCDIYVVPIADTVPRCHHHQRDHRLAMNGGRRCAP